MDASELPNASVPKTQLILEQAFLQALKPTARSLVEALPNPEAHTPAACVAQLLKRDWVRGWADSLGDNVRVELEAYVAGLLAERRTGRTLTSVA
jgi:hypothetical protein